MKSNERRYDDEESARIVRRALEIQQREQPPTVAGEGLSLSDLVGIGREAGIAPELIVSAARELSAEGAHRPGGFVRLFFGGPIRSTGTAFSTAVLTPELLDALLGQLPMLTDEMGNGSVVGRTIRWSGASANGYGRWMITIAAADGGGTEIAMDASLAQPAGGLFGGIMGSVGLGGGLGIGIGVGLAALKSPLFAVLVPVGLLLGSWLLARGIFEAVRRKKQATIGSTVDAIRAAIETFSDGEKPHGES